MSLRLNAKLLLLKKMQAALSLSFKVKDAAAAA
jgi:hypothetical protein